jgi:dTDP-4-amino-4,6-dideoxygalactose transaminase
MRSPAIPLFSSARAEAGVDLREPIDRVLRSHHYILGAEVQGFEAEFARYIGVAHCVAVANGTDALEIALRALGVASGDRVVTAANAGFYASTAIHAVAGTPLYADIDDERMTLAPAAVERALAHRPKAVIVTHLYGRLADVEAIASLCRAAGVALVEDCAQAHGAALRGRRAGSFGDIACFSFYPTKNLGAAGDGGAITTNHEGLERRSRQLRQYGWSRKYAVDVAGGRNSRLDEIQAAVLRAKLPTLDAQNAERRRLAARYDTAFAQLPLRVAGSRAADDVVHLYVVRTRRRDQLRSALLEAGIGSDIHYPVADHSQAAYAKQAAAVELPLTEAACRECLSLPCFPGLSDAEQDQVIEAVRAFFSVDPR